MSVGKKIIIAMSGGVDSSISALLLRQAGYEVIAVSFLLPCLKVTKSKKKTPESNKKLTQLSLSSIKSTEQYCNFNAIKIAQQLCQRLDISHYLFDLSQEFEKTVIDYYLNEYQQYLTPNPCVVCNRVFKFEQLLKIADYFQVEQVATGHYARVSSVGQQSYLLQARDLKKDQSYYLALLTQQILKRVVFPLGDLKKTEVYQLAQENNLDFLKAEKSSQDICFLDDQPPAQLLKKIFPSQNGEIIDQQGQVLGQHQGLRFYTIGQRQGLGLAGGPYYVLAFNVDQNQVIVSKNEQDLRQKKVLLTKVNLISGQPVNQALPVLAKIRYRQEPTKAVLQAVYPKTADKKTAAYQLIFQEAQRAVTPGQFAVFYQGETCLGGGQIIK